MHHFVLVVFCIMQHQLEQTNTYTFFSGGFLWCSRCCLDEIKQSPWKPHLWSWLCWHGEGFWKDLLCMLNYSGSESCANELSQDVKASTCLDNSSRCNQQHAKWCQLNTSSWGWAATQSSKLERCGSEQQSFWVLGQNSESMSGFYHVLVTNVSALSFHSSRSAVRYWITHPKSDLSLKLQALFLLRVLPTQ